jgi:hypothetical protein
MAYKLRDPRGYELAPVIFTGGINTHQSVRRATTGRIDAQDRKLKLAKVCDPFIVSGLVAL